MTLFAMFAAALLASAPESTLTGQWQSKGDAGEHLSIEVTAEAIHMKEDSGGKERVAYSCRTDGKECAFAEDGHKGKVSLWFNGDKLVELRTRGTSTVKRRFTVQPGGSSLQLEVMPMSPGAKVETLTYLRAK